MKSSAVFTSAALAQLAAGQTTVAAPPTAPTSSSLVFWTDSKPTGTWSAPAPGSTSTGGGNFGAAICGQGFTYCGYILRDHQNFREEDIVRVYCASGKDNCANGKTKSDPLQALYVCLPPQSQAIPVPNDSIGITGGSDKDVVHPLQPHAEHNNGGGENNNNYNYNYNIKNKNIHGLRNRRQAAAAPTSPAGAAPSAQGGLTNNGGTCSSTPTTGNQLALLCSCGNKCLNPKEDHIGRCDTPCSQ